MGQTPSPRAADAPALANPGCPTRPGTVTPRDRLAGGVTDHLTSIHTDTDEEARRDALTRLHGLLDRIPKTRTEPVATNRSCRSLLCDLGIGVLPGGAKGT